MTIFPFDQPGRFYRGNIHTHSTASDGGLSPEAICKLYQDAGYSFVAISDHFLSHYGYPITETAMFRSETFTTLPAAELHVKGTEFADIWHILAIGLPSDFAPPLNGETGNQIATRALAAGAFVVAAHPYRLSLTETDILSLGNIHALEIFNGISVNFNDRSDSWELLDTLLMRGHRYTATAADDAHFFPEEFDGMRGWVWVKSEALTPEALLAALKSGSFYASTGPEIYDIQLLPGDKIYVSCSPVERIFVTGGADRAASRGGEALTEAILDLKGIKAKAPYCRVTVRDAQGRRAWSNPIPLP